MSNILVITWLTAAVAMARGTVVRQCTAGDPGLGGHCPGSPMAPTVEQLLNDIPPPQHMYTGGDKPQVVKVLDNVYQATGFSFASVVMIVGEDGVIIVDTTDSLGPATKIAQLFREITTLPTVLIIYTHFHADHSRGAKAFIQPGDPEPEIWAHKNWITESSRLHPITPTFVRRGNAFLGLHVGDFQVQQTAPIVRSVHDALRGTDSGFLPYTKLLQGDTDATFAGITFSMVEIPGETEDHMAVWLPESGTIICGDVIYESFPNLAPARGTPPRDVPAWLASLRRIRAMRPKILIPIHASHVLGEQTIQELLDVYISGIQYVHDQTVRYINQDRHPYDIAELVELPPELKQHPWLREVYGTAAWSSRGIYVLYMGWFPAFVEDLNPIGPEEKAHNMIGLLGRQRLLDAAERALESGDHQWALELVSYVYRADPTDEEAIYVRRLALRKVTEDNTSAIGRFYTMTSILEDAGLVEHIRNTPMLAKFPIELFMEQQRYRLRAEKIPAGKEITGCFHITDSQATYCVHLQHYVIDVLASDPGEWSFKMTSSEAVLRSILMGVQSLQEASYSGAIAVEGSFDDLQNLVSYLEM